MTTIHAINSGILKLARKVRACTVYRGVSGVVLPQQFEQEDQFGIRGGASMATTSQPSRCCVTAP